MKQIALVLLLLLPACSLFKGKSDPYMQIQPGMEAMQVQQILGNPVDRKFFGTREEWIYRKNMEKGLTKTKVIFLENKRVVSLGDDELAVERQFEIEKAKAQGSTDTSASSLPCGESNQYGFYTKGGGCNQYGCWSPGGSCNEFGCSTTGKCDASGCAQRVPSFQCAR